MPDGESALVWKSGNKDWYIRRIRNGQPGKWVGEYKTAEEALTELETEVNQA